MAESFTIDLTDAQKARLQAKVRAAGINPSGGVLPETDGTILEFSVDGNAVTFAVLAKPRLAALWMIKGRVQKLINNAS